MSTCPTCSVLYIVLMSSVYFVLLSSAHLVIQCILFSSYRYKTYVLIIRYVCVLSTYFEVWYILFYVQIYRSISVSLNQCSFMSSSLLYHQLHITSLIYLFIHSILQHVYFLFSLQVMVSLTFTAHCCGVILFYVLPSCSI